MSDSSTPLHLFVRESGDHTHPPLVILHGFLGSSRNWGSVARKLAEKYWVLATDLRNHGRSPQSDSMTFADCVDDVKLLFDELKLEKAILIGHSLGGKVAMRFACEHPERVEELFVLDIAPREYQPDMGYIDALNQLDLGIMDRRSDVDEALSDIVADDATRAFLLTNLRRNENHEFYWLPNLSVLKRERKTIGGVPLTKDHTFDGPTKWVVGGQSDYVKKSDTALMKKHFTDLEQHVFKKAGHNVHIDGGQDFIDLVL